LALDSFKDDPQISQIAQILRFDFGVVIGSKRFRGLGFVL